MPALTAKEFVQRILSGERDFSYIQLRDFDSNSEQFDTFVQMNEYLKNIDLSKEPLILNGADLNNIKAGGIWLPYVKAHGATFREVYFRGANLKYGEFQKASFYRTDLDQANCQYCDFYNTYFKEASLHSTHLGKANFKFADLTGARHLDYAHEVEHATFEKTYVREEEKKIILDALKKNPQYGSFEAVQFFRESPSKPPKK
jgi:uncharacterized protein YjbI with pentapeptide repeats